MPRIFFNETPKCCRQDAGSTHHNPKNFILNILPIHV